MGTVDFGGGPLTSAGGYDVFVAKFDAAGNHLWSRRFGDALDQHADAVTVDGSDNVIVTGDFGGTVDFGGGQLTSAGNLDIFVAEFDGGGNHLWSRRLGNNYSEFAYGVAADGSGNVILTGSFEGAVDFGGGDLTSAGDSDIFVAKFDAAGNHLWSRRFGDASGQGAYAVAIDGSDNVIVTGSFSGAVDFGGGPLTSAGSEDVFVAKFNSAGSHLWSQGFGDTYSQRAVAVAIDGSESVLLTGFNSGIVDFGGGPITTAGSNDIFVVKFDPTGAHVWSRGFGDPNVQQGQGIAVDGSGNVTVTGWFMGSVDFGGGSLTSAGLDDIFVARFDAAGNPLWSERFGDTTYQEGIGIATDGSGNVLLSGFFGGTVDFGGGPLTSAGLTDIYVAKFNPGGPVPTMLQAFDAAYRDGVELTWRLSELGRDARFFVLRSQAGRDFTELRAASVEIDGLNAAYRDGTVEPGVTYRYRVDVIDEDARRILFTTRDIAIPAATLSLGPAKPNPFNPVTTIRYIVPDAARVHLAVYDASGRLIRTLVDGPAAAGAHTATWHGLDDNGAAVSSGVYFLRLHSGSRVETEKVVLLK
jgi:hypothetical protein